MLTCGSPDYCVLRLRTRTRPRSRRSRGTRRTSARTPSRHRVGSSRDGGASAAGAPPDASADRRPEPDPSLLSATSPSTVLAAEEAPRVHTGKAAVAQQLDVDGCLGAATSCAPAPSPRRLLGAREARTEAPGAAL